MKETEECFYCSAELNGYESYNKRDLCEECDNNYEDKTGYCSLQCCIDGQCDGSC